MSRTHYLAEAASARHLRQEDEEVLMKSRNSRHKKSFNSHSSAAFLFFHLSNPIRSRESTSFATMSFTIQCNLISVLIRLPGGRAFRLPCDGFSP